MYSLVKKHKFLLIMTSSIKQQMINYFKVIFLFTFFLIIMFFKRMIFPSDIIFYEGIISSFIFSISILLSRIINLDKTIVLFLTCVLFWSLGPTILDRSVSITIIGKLDEKKAVSLLDLNEDFKNVYLIKNNAVLKRLDEQIETGNVEFINGKYKLTKKGVFSKRALKWFTDFYNIDSNMINKR